MLYIENFQVLRAFLQDDIAMITMFSSASETRISERGEVATLKHLKQVRVAPDV